MKSLITGIGGFVGSHLAETLIAENKYNVFGLMRDLEKNENILGIEKNLNLTRCDINDFESVFKSIKNIKPDVIFHLAGQPFVPSSFESTADTFKVNVIGAINILEAIKSCEINPRIIIVTSGEIYGEAIGISLHTEKKLPHPVNPYAASKTSIDFIAQTYKRYEGLNIVIARPFNHTGPKQRNNFVCSSIAYQIAKIEKENLPKILKVGNIKARRMFSDVRDMAKGYSLLSEIDNSQDFIFNISTDEINSIEDVIKLYEEISGYKFELNIEPKRLRGYDIDLMAGDSSLFKSKTNWKNNFTLKQTLTDILNYWRTKL